MGKKQEILKILSSKLRDIVSRLTVDFEELYEIRLRVNEPFIILLGGRPSAIIESSKCDYTHIFLKDSTEKERYTEEYYIRKQNLINRMHKGNL